MTPAIAADEAGAKPQEVEAVVSNIKNHAEFTPSFAPLKFEPKAAYIATAESVRDSLIRSWNLTHQELSAKDPKQAYYISMEFLQVNNLLDSLCMQEMFICRQCRKDLSLDLRCGLQSHYPHAFIGVSLLNHPHA